MKLYAGIDLHSTTNHIGIINDQNRRVFRKKLTNDPTRILEALAPFKKNQKGVVVESTYNWYWLVDELMDQGEPVAVLEKPLDLIGKPFHPVKSIRHFYCPWREPAGVG